MPVPISNYIAAKKYEILVISFLILIFGDTFSNLIAFTVLLPMQNMVVAFVVFYNNKCLSAIIGVIILLCAGIILFNCYQFTQLGAGLLTIVYFIYFLLISFNVFQKIFYAKTVSSEMISAVLCGFILLCLTGAILFVAIEVNVPHSFSNISIGVNRFKNLIYFSFTTLLTIGYGDIVPLSFMAKRAVMFIGITGHFYTVVLTGIIIGKYIKEDAK